MCLIVVFIITLAVLSLIKNVHKSLTCLCKRGCVSLPQVTDQADLKSNENNTRYRISELKQWLQKLTLIDLFVELPIRTAESNPRRWLQCDWLHSMEPYRQLRMDDGLYVSVFFIFYLIHLLTAIWLTPGGSSTVHSYTQTIHRTTQWNRIPRTEHT